MPGHVSFLHGERGVGAVEYDPIDSHCAEDKLSKLEAVNELLTKDNAEGQNGDDAGDA